MGMAGEPNAGPMDGDDAQLVEVRASIPEAAGLFVRPDATGRTPIVIVPRYQNRVRNPATIAALALFGVGLLAWFLPVGGWVVGVAVALGVAALAAGLYHAFRVAIPEGVTALLARGGKHQRAIGAGVYLLPPTTVVSHLVTARAIPYAAPVRAAATADNVRAAVDAALTFVIADPYRFVYGISTSAFDQIFQAACQDALRTMVRQTTAERIADLTRATTADLRAALNADVERYGVAIANVNIVSAVLPDAFMRSQEARQLAVLQRAEHAEQQALLSRRQADEDELTRQRALAGLARAREALQAEIDRAEARRRVAEVDAETERLRLAMLDERLRQYPTAADWEWQGEQLAVARALAANARVILQIGAVADLMGAAVLDGLRRDDRPPADVVAPAPRGDESDASPEQPA
jgi:regulator of protease activity HflC (stomatin/prohibitin superfamily)